VSNIARFGQIALKTEDASAVRGYALLFSGLNFSLSYGQFAAVKGPNGSGKTTFLRIVAGLAETETGTIERFVPEAASGRGLFFLGHELGLRTSETPKSHLTDWADIHGVSRQTIPGALQRLGLETRQDVPAWSLSAGQKKRVALARALVAPCPIWLLDEPASALDVKGQTLLCALMKEHLSDGGAILAALHDPMEISPDIELDIGAFVS